MAICFLCYIEFLLLYTLFIKNLKRLIFIKMYLINFNSVCFVS